MIDRLLVYKTKKLSNSNQHYYLIAFFHIEQQTLTHDSSRCGTVSWTHLAWHEHSLVQESSSLRLMSQHHYYLTSWLKLSHLDTGRFLFKHPSIPFLSSCSSHIQVHVARKNFLFQNEFSDRTRDHGSERVLTQCLI